MTAYLQVADGLFFRDVPEQDDVSRYVDRALSAVRHPEADLVVRVVEEPEMRDLNHRFRGGNAPTNVLAFPFEYSGEAECGYLGDIVICLPVVSKEAKSQKISFSRHFSHLVVHGTLHLCGLDHDTDEKAEEMELLEKRVLEYIDVD